MKKSSLFLATALVSMLGAGSVLAQTTTTSPSTTTNTHTTATTPATNTASNNIGPAQFWTNDNGNEWRAAKLKGLAVYNDNNDKLGNIDDMLVDNSGQIKAVIIGVGGFLGMGEHFVAVPFNQLQFTYNDRNTVANTTGLPGANTPTTMNRDAAGNPTTAGTTNTGLGSNTNAANVNNNNRAATPATTVAARNRENGTPDRAVLNATKDQLKAAPEFKYNS